MDRQTHRFLFFSNDSRSAPHPPTLLKLSSSSSAPLAPSASQSFTEAFTQSAAQILRVRVSATRLVSGQQHYLDQAIDTEDLSQCARDAQKSQRLTIDEAVGLLFEAIEKRDYEATYDKHSKKCKISFEDLGNFRLELDFEKAKHDRITPAFGLAFEAAQTFAEEAENAETAAKKAQTSLKDKERDANQAEKKANNLKIELAETKNALSRLLATGGSSLDDLKSGSSNRGLRERSTLVIESGKNGNEAVESPGKKRKQAAPTFAKAGRTVQKSVKSGFLADAQSSSSSDSDEAAGSKESKADGKGKGKATVGSKVSTDSGSDSVPKDVQTDNPAAGRSKSPAAPSADKSSITRSAAASVPRPGHTATKPAAKGFLQNGSGDESTEDSASDEERSKKKPKKGK